jgi:hypothetical protein
MEALDYFERCKPITRLEYDSDDVLKDAIQAVGLLIEDGLEITFAHRSFQEYFVSRFIQRSRPQIKKQLIERYRPKLHEELVMGLLYELDPDAVEEYYIIPGLNSLRNMLQIKRKIGVSHYIRFIRIMYEAFEIGFDDGYLEALVNDIEVNALVDFVRERVMVRKGARDEGKRLEESMRMTYKAEGVRAVEIKSSDEFVQKLIASGCFDIGLLPELLEVGESLKRKQRDAAASLQSILGDGVQKEVVRLFEPVQEP